MNLQDNVRVISGSFRTASIWFWILPGAVEFSFWSVLVGCLLLYSLPESVPNRQSAIFFLILMGVSVAAGITAFRQRIHPVLGHLFGAVSIVVPVCLLGEMAEAALTSKGVWAQGSWLETIYKQAKGPVIIVGGVTFVLLAMHRGMRRRHHYVLRLNKVLTTGGVIARRQAVITLLDIETFDIASRAANIRWLDQWLFRSDAPTSMTYAIPALQGALHDDDHFVRQQAAKVLMRLGVTLGNEANAPQRK